MIGKLIGRIKYRRIRTFTYYIPAPRPRKSGYREKGLDAMTDELTDLGFEVLDIQMQTINGVDCSGMWVILKLLSTNKVSYSLPVSEFPKEILLIQTKEEENKNGENLNNEKSISVDANELKENVGEIYYID